MKPDIKNKIIDFNTFIFKFISSLLKKTTFLTGTAIKKFNHDKCTLQASALTFYSLLSIVPVMAMAFGIAKGFGFEKILQKELLERLSGQEEIAHRIIEFSGKLLSETKGGIMAVMGLIFLIWAVVKMFSRIEAAFNAIWDIKRGRPAIRKFTDYIALFLTAPFLVILSGSATVFITTRLNKIMSGPGYISFLHSVTSFFLKLLPYTAIWMLFTFLYIFMPNKKISVKAGLIGGIIAGTIYQTAQMIYIGFQVGVSHYNAIYGSFAALPLFLIWLEVSWIILLFGAEIVFICENADDIGISKDWHGEYPISIKLKKLFCLRIVLLCVKRFAQGVKPASDLDIASELGISVGLVRIFLLTLVNCEILAEVNTKNGCRFQPARSIENLSIMSVIDAIEEKGQGDYKGIQIPETIEFNALNDALIKFKETAEKSPANRLIKDI